MAGPVPGMPMRARGGGVKSKGMNVGTKVQHDKGKNDLDDLNRPARVVKFNTGGGVVSFRARGGKIYSPEKGGMGPKLPGGAGGAKGRKAKAKMTHHGSQV